MDELTAQLRRSRAIGLVLPLFFLSGATALAYQTLWVRELQVELFGTSTFAISTVLAAFMGGLALGGFAMARLADRVTRPLHLYGWLEVGIGLYALAFPWLVQGLQPVYLEAWRTLRPDPLTFGLIQFGLVSIGLVLPTAAMGATLPLLARFATERLGAAGERVGTLYAVNTLGAVVGTAACGFGLLPGLGRATTTGLAAGANLLLGVAAIALSAWAGRHQTTVVNDLSEPHPTSRWLLPVGMAIGLAGFSALAYEVAWTRLLGLMLGASTYAFTIMLLSFLVGIALGGALGGPLADRMFTRWGAPGVLLTFAGVEVAIALVSYAMMYLYPQLPFLYVWLFDALRAEARPERAFEVSMVVAACIMTPPAVLMGLHFPLAVRAVIGDRDQLGGPVGVVYGLNTLGGVIGAFLAGFVLLPMLKLQGTVYTAAIIELVAAGGLLVAVAQQPAWRSIAVAFGMSVAGIALALGGLATRPPWNPMLMTAGMYTYVSNFDDHSREGILAYAVEKYELLYYAEGLSTVVTVARSPRTGNLWLANNGKIDASTEGDLPTQVLCSLLPMQYVEDPKRVLVIGLASGITAGAVTQIEAVERLEIVELEPRIEEAARLFGPYNHDVLDDPRVELIINDGRNHVLLAEPGTYDVIVSEPSNPWITGVSNLFTREFLEIGKSRLAEGGVWSQWIQMYGMAPDDLRTLLGTVADVFPYVNLYVLDHADLVLVASEKPLPATLDRAAHLLAWPGARRELASVDERLQGEDNHVPLRTPANLLSFYAFDQDVMRKLGQGYPMNTDDNMIIEYSAPLNLHRTTQIANNELIAEHAEVPVRWVPGAEALAELAKAYRARWDERAFPTMEAAIEQAPTEETAIAWSVLVEAWRAEDADWEWVDE
ncbi:MAG: fused MFS/spermidine synthase [Myxococcota bacterium]